VSLVECNAISTAEYHGYSSDSGLWLQVRSGHRTMRRLSFIGMYSQGWDNRKVGKNHRKWRKLLLST